jgi:YHS domain-containing protein
MTSQELVTDPVCGMVIDPRQAAGVRTHGDRAIHLCSLGCLAKFDADGAAYIAASRVEGYRTWHATILTHVNSAPREEQDPPHA